MDAAPFFSSEPGQSMREFWKCFCAWGESQHTVALEIASAAIHDDKRTTDLDANIALNRSPKGATS